MIDEDIDVLKIDVEGHEGRVFRGSSGLMRRRRISYILVEIWHSSSNGYIEELLAMGYAVSIR